MENTETREVGVEFHCCRAQMLMAASGEVRWAPSGHHPHHPVAEYHCCQAGRSHLVETQGQVKKRHRVRRQPFSSLSPWFPKLLLAAAVELAAASELDAAAAAAAGTFNLLLLFDQLQPQHHWNLLLVLLREPAAVAGCCC